MKLDPSTRKNDNTTVDSVHVHNLNANDMQDYATEVKKIIVLKCITENQLSALNRLEIQHRRQESGLH